MCKHTAAEQYHPRRHFYKQTFIMSPTQPVPHARRSNENHIKGRVSGITGNCGRGGLRFHCLSLRNKEPLDVAVVFQPSLFIAFIVCRFKLCVLKASIHRKTITITICSSRGSTRGCRSWWRIYFILALFA